MIRRAGDTIRPEVGLTGDTHIDEVTAARAAYTVAAHATGPADAARLLTMLGLLDAGRIVTPSGDLPEYRGAIGERAHLVIAAVEDWQNNEHELAMQELRGHKAAIQRVRELHRSDLWDDSGECFHCGDNYPCPTISALDGDA